jgi:NAD(P)-dependent dehydrogenase (short-subunit alcohol dehydrogenase family)
MKKVLIIGGTGNIGSAIVKELEKDTDVISASYSDSNYPVDLGDAETIDALYKNFEEKSLDGIVCAAARGVVFKKPEAMTIDDYTNSMQQKLLGQIQLVLKGMKYLNDNGSFTLTTGCLNRDYITGGSAAAMINDAVEGFAKASALELPRGLRINVVSPNLLEVSAEQYAALMPGFPTVNSDKVVKAYRKSIYGVQTGQVYTIE